jgi:N-acetylglucosaminyldiphosphoundecaprenol N-acetyl-beta-D-mannosaminyltransferase
MNFFGIPLTRIDDVDAYFHELVRTKSPRTVVTPNPEILLDAACDEEFKSILLLATDRLPDGIGLYLAETMRPSRLPKWLVMALMPYWGLRLIFGRRGLEARLGQRLAGSKLTTMLLEHAAREGWTVAILDRDASDWPAKLEVQRNAPAMLEAKFPGLHIHYQTVEQNTDWGRAREELARSGATVLLSILGMKRQEASLLQFVPSVPSLRIAVGVGSSIDTHLGLETRAPDVIGRMGLEWLYRLVFSRRRRLNRIKRILRAVFVFPWRVLSSDRR